MFREDRVTIQERESQEATKEQQELLNKQRAEERKKDSIRVSKVFVILNCIILMPSWSHTNSSALKASLWLF